MLICPYFDMVGERGEIPKKLTMFNEFRLIVNFVGKSDCMSTDFRIFIDGLDILGVTYKHFIYSLLFFTIKDEIFNLRIKCHQFTHKMLSGWFYYVTKCP